MAQRTRRHQPRTWLAFLTITLLLGGCTSSTPTASPPLTAASPTPTAAPTRAPTLAAPATPIAVLLPTPTLRATGTPTAWPTEEVTPAASPTEPSTPSPGSPASPTALPTSGPDLAISSVARAPADPAEAKTAASSINAFGLDLFRQLLADPQLQLSEKNTVFSPTSIALALAMARAGAKGETASQMDAVLHTSGWDAMGAGLNSLMQALASRETMFTEADGNPQLAPALRIANAAYAQQGWKIEQPYLDAIAAAFGAGLHLVDFATNPEAARKAIDAWVSDQTAGRIPELLQPGDLDPLTRLVLANATYMKAEWEWWFSQSDTKSAPFTRLGGTQVDVPTMYRLGPAEGSGPIPYVSGTGWQAVELRYKSAEGSSPLAMTLILPADLAAFEASLTAGQLARISTALAQQREASVRVSPCTGTLAGYQGGCYPYELSLYLPRFDIGTRA